LLPLLHCNCPPSLPVPVQVTELKGNIRVLARIRPMSEKEHSSSGSEAAMRVINEETVSVAGTSVREYEFDRVFGPKDGQAQVGCACAAAVCMAIAYIAQCTACGVQVAVYQLHPTQPVLLCCQWHCLM
jgi:hypothetical protein